MTGLVVATPSLMDEMIPSQDDVDTEKGPFRLHVRDVIWRCASALMSSENRAALP
jgi:hypothetical protein